MSRATVNAQRRGARADDEHVADVLEDQRLYIRHWRRRRDLVDPLNDLLDRRPELRDMAQAGVRFVVAIGENA